jgi:hypothetical protein
MHLDQFQVSFGCVYAKSFSRAFLDARASQATAHSSDPVIELVPFLFPRSLLGLITIGHVAESAHKDHEEEDEDERWHDAVLCFSVSTREPTIRSPFPIHRGCVYWVTNLLSPLTFSLREAERRESE